MPRRRTVLWIAGGATAWLVVVGALLVAIVRASRVTDPEWSVDEGTLPAHLAGRWSWDTESPPCDAEAHTISFSADERTMTIARSPTASDTGYRAIYDVRRVTPSRIRGAIRGETRVDDNGAPVVWELVMFGPDSYRWRDTTWSEGRYTGAITRCPDQRDDDDDDDAPAADVPTRR